MARARKVFEGELVCYLIAAIPGVVWNPRQINPDAINPWKVTPEGAKKLLELKEWQRKRRNQILNTPPSKR